jgi:hypothetical protein
MTITTFTRRVLAVVAVGALAVPAAAQAKGGEGKGKGSGRDKASVAEVARPGKGESRRNAKKNPTVSHIFKGTIVSVDVAEGTAVVKVAKANHHGRVARNAQVTFDLAAAKLVVADVNADGAVNLADVAVGDKVLVQARLPKRGADLTRTVTARKLVDQSRPHGGTDAEVKAPVAG